MNRKLVFTMCLLKYNAHVIAYNLHNSMKLILTQSSIMQMKTLSPRKVKQGWAYAS